MWKLEFGSEIPGQEKKEKKTERQMTKDRYIAAISLNSFKWEYSLI